MFEMNVKHLNVCNERKTFECFKWTEKTFECLEWT